MALGDATPVVPISEEGDNITSQELAEQGAETRVRLTRPPDRDNELIAVAASHGPLGILAVLRTCKDYGWFVTLALRAIEVCLSPRRAKEPVAALRDCDPVSFSMQMYELEIIDEIFQLMKHYEHVKDVQRTGLAIVEILIMDDAAWRDEIARKGGVGLVCEIAKKRQNHPQLVCQVMTCMSYLAAEDYIEVMLGQHGALESVVTVLQQYKQNLEAATRASLALLNLTVCEPHVEELMEKQAILPVLDVLDAHPKDVHLVTILCGVLANYSVMEEVRDILVRGGLFQHVQRAMKLEPENAVLQVALLKAIVNFSTDPAHYMKMDELDIPTLVGQAMVNHADDAGVQKYGNFFLGQYTNCPLM